MVDHSQTLLVDAHATRLRAHEHEQRQGLIALLYEAIALSRRCEYEVTVNYY